MSNLNGKLFQGDSTVPSAMENAHLLAKSPSAPLSVGEQLLAHREAKGWTVEQVANAIKLAPRQVDAIEADNYAMLPGMAVTRGFVRAYAKLLKIDATPLLARMESATEPMPLGNRMVATPFSNGRNASFGRKRSSRKTVAAVALLAVATAMIIGYQKFGSVMPSFNTLGFDRTNEKTQPTAESVLPVPVAVSPSGDQTSLSGPVAATDPAGVAAVVPNSVALSVGSTAGDVQEQASDPTGGVGPKSGNLLQITMKQDSWLEVRRTDSNDVLAARLAKAGTVETFELDSPVKLTIGNVAGVQAVLRGEPFALKTAAGGNVARMTVK